MEWTLAQKIGFYGISVPLAIGLWAFILLKISDWAEEGWRKNNRKKKWLVCIFVAVLIVGKTVNGLMN